MTYKKSIGFLRGLVIFPLFLTTLPININSIIPPKVAEVAVDQLPAQEIKISDEAYAWYDKKITVLINRADKIDAYFSEHDLPLAGYGLKMVIEAQKNNLDWRLLPAVAMRESTAGKNACRNNFYNVFGWNSCKTNFSSYEEAIEIVARNLGGNNPKTVSYYKDTLALREILENYNGRAVRSYPDQVMAIMRAIAPDES